MIKKKLVFALVLVLCVSLIAVGCSSGEKKEEKVTLRIGHEMPENHPYHLGSVKFGEILAEKTNGKFEVVVYPNAQLGKQKALAEMVAADQLDFCLVWQGILEGYDPDAGVISLPFLFKDWDHVYRTVDGEIGEQMFKGLEEKGIKVLVNFNNGLYNFVSTVPIEKPADMKGVKLRVQPSAVFTATGEMLGAVVTPMAFSEVYTALQLGAVDAEIQGPINVRKSKHFEVADYTCECHINHLLEPLLMSVKKFNSFSPEDQKAIREAALEAAQYQRELAEKADGEDTKFIKDNGMKYTKADLNEWREAVAPVYDKFPQWKGIVEKVKAIE